MGELARLAKLKAQGHITQADYEVLRDQLLQAAASTTLPKADAKPEAAAPGQAAGTSTGGASGGENKGTEQAKRKSSFAPDVPTVRPAKVAAGWVLPTPVQVLAGGAAGQVDDGRLELQRSKIDETLQAFGIPAQVAELNHGPVFTQYLVGLAPQAARGSKRMRGQEIFGLIADIVDDLALALSGAAIRVQSPVPGTAFASIEVPNQHRAAVSLAACIDTPEYRAIKSPLALALGQDAAGHTVCADLATLPHLWIVGPSGAGKSTCLNAIVSGLLMANTPDQLRILAVDVVRVELGRFNGVPHLLAPVLNDLERTLKSVQWVVRELERRYSEFSGRGARSIADFNRKAAAQLELAHWVVAIDGLSQLENSESSGLEAGLLYIAKRGQLVGIHLIVATHPQGPRAVKGSLQESFPARIEFGVELDDRNRGRTGNSSGQQGLLPRGEMHFMAAPMVPPVRAQCITMDDAEIDRLIAFWKEQDREREALRQAKEAAGADKPRAQPAATPEPQAQLTPAAPTVAKGTDPGTGRNGALGCLVLIACGLLFWLLQWSSSGSAAAPTPTPTPTPIPTVISFALIAPRWEQYKDEIVSKNVDGWYGWVSNIRAKSGKTEISIDLDAPDVFFSNTEIVILVSNAAAEGLAVNDSVRFSGIVSKADKDTPLAGVSLRLDDASIARAAVPAAIATRTSVPAATTAASRTPLPSATARHTATARATATRRPTETAEPTFTPHADAGQAPLATTVPAQSGAGAKCAGSYMECLDRLVAAITNLSDHQQALPGNPELLLDGVWTPRLEQLRQELADSLAELKRLGAPAAYAKLHAHMTEAATKYVQAAAELVKFASDRIFERLERSSVGENEGNAAMEAANAELDRLLASKQSAATTTALAPAESATPAAAATAVPVATGAAQEYIIVEVPRIVGASIDAVDRMLGEPDDAFDWYAGDITQLPLGGSERDYTVRGYTVWVLFDPQGIAKGIIVQIGLAADGYRLDKWPVILSRFGLGYTKAPDFKSSMALRWNNSNGYVIYMSGVPVDNLEIMKVP